MFIPKRAMTNNSHFLEQHLRSFWNSAFDSDIHWEWGGKKLGPRRSERLNQLREPLTTGATPEQLEAFYDYMARPNVSGGQVNSSKADAIRASGYAAELALLEQGQHLQIGLLDWISDDILRATLPPAAKSLDVIYQQRQSIAHVRKPKNEKLVM